MSLVDFFYTMNNLNSVHLSGLSNNSDFVSKFSRLLSLLKNRLWGCSYSAGEMVIF